jgi:hypothetical protein
MQKACFWADSIGRYYYIPQAQATVFELIRFARDMAADI